MQFNSMTPYQSPNGNHIAAAEMIVIDMLLLQLSNQINHIKISYQTFRRLQCRKERCGRNLQRSP